jgi:hypothetical protein
MLRRVGSISGQSPIAAVLLRLLDEICGSAMHATRNTCLVEGVFVSSFVGLSLADLRRFIDGLACINNWYYLSLCVVFLQRGLCLVLTGAVDSILPSSCRALWYKFTLTHDRPDLSSERAPPKRLDSNFGRKKTLVKSPRLGSTPTD